MEPVIKGPEGTAPKITSAVVAVPRSGTRSTYLKTAGQTQAIPVGAFNWTVTILTGTATFDGVAVPAGFSAGDEGALLSALTVVMDTPGTAFMSWMT
jgi:hypothetical protein